MTASEKKPMLHRRNTFAIISFVMAACLAGLPRLAAAQTPAQAEAFIQAVGNQLVSVVNGRGSQQQKSQRLGQIVDQDVDVPGIARFCLGRFWRLATPAQQQQYVQLFHKVLLRSIDLRIGQYEGVQFTVGRAVSRAEGAVVATTIVRPNQAPASVSWVVNSVNGGPKIVDVIAEGTSLRLTQRDDYASFIVQHGDSVQALLDALKRQVSAKG